MNFPTTNDPRIEYRSGEGVNSIEIGHADFCLALGVMQDKALPLPVLQRITEKLSALADEIESELCSPTEHY